MLPEISLTDGIQNYELSFGIDFTDRLLSIDEILDLPQKIAQEDWISIISKRFSDTGKQIDNELCGRIAVLVKNHLNYVQQLSQQVWLRTSSHCDESIVREAFDSLLKQRFNCIQWDIFHPAFSFVVE